MSFASKLANFIYSQKYSEETIFPLGEKSLITKTWLLVILIDEKPLSQIDWMINGHIYPKFFHKFVVGSIVCDDYETGKLMVSCTRFFRIRAILSYSAYLELLIVVPIIGILYCIDRIECAVARNN